MSATTETAPSTSPVPPFDFLDLKAQFAKIRADVMAAVSDVMESQKFILGNEVRAFEEEIAAMLGAKYAVACGSGSDALVLAMMAAGIGPGHEVITTPFTFVATAGSIVRVGAKPVFVDIDAETFNIDPQKVAASITSATRAVLPVHLFGLPAEMCAIIQIAGDRGLLVIEDAAQAIGARYRECSVGTVGSFGCFSFFPSKNLGGAGDGGLVTTQDASTAERLRMLRVHGSRTKYHHEILGTNSRLDALQAVILRVKLRHLSEWTRERRERAERYRALIEAMGLTPFARAPRPEPAHSRHVYNQFCIRCARRDELRDYLSQHGIPTEIYYPVPLHLQPAFAYLGYKLGDFPQAELASTETLALPIYPELKESQQESVIRTIADFYSGKD